MKSRFPRKSSLLFLLFLTAAAFSQGLSDTVASWMDGKSGTEAFWNDPAYWSATQDSLWERSAARLAQPVRLAWFQGLYRDARLRGQGDRLENLILTYFQLNPSPPDTSRLFWDILLQSALRRLTPPAGWKRALGLLSPEADNASQRVIRALILHGWPPEGGYEALKLPRSMVWGGQMPTVFPEWFSAP